MEYIIEITSLVIANDLKTLEAILIKEQSVFGQVTSLWINHRVSE